MWTFFFDTAFSVHYTPLFLLSLQVFLIFSTTLGCLRVWQFPLHFLVQIQLILTTCYVGYRKVLWDNRGTRQL